MTQSTHTKRALLASALSVVACCALLIGSTFAWFTDEVTSGNNRIVAGNLDVEVYHGDDLSEPVNGATDLFQVDAWEPGVIAYENFKVVNQGSLALQYWLSMNIGDYNTVEGEDGKDTGKSLKDVIGMAVTTEPFDGTREAALALDYQPLESFIREGSLLETGASDTCTVVLYWEPTAVDNDYNLSNGKVSSDGEPLFIDLGVKVTASQVPHEFDSFGDDYDAGILTAEAFMLAAEKGGTIELAADLQLPGDVTFPKDTVLKMNGHTLTMGEDGGHSLKAAVGTTLTVQGNGRIYGVLYAEKKFTTGSTLIVEAGPDFEVVSNSDVGWAIYATHGCTVRIDGGTYTSLKKGTGVIKVVGMANLLEVKNATIRVAPDSVVSAIGIQSFARENLLENVTVDAKYSVAVDFNNERGKATIRGGSFTTDQVSPDWEENPTIKYQGTLDITNASITRVGVGILYSRPEATVVEGLNGEETCTFLMKGTGDYPEIGY